jgi:hypothetical protein
MKKKRSLLKAKKWDNEYPIANNNANPFPCRGRESGAVHLIVGLHLIKTTKKQYSDRKEGQVLPSGFFRVRLYRWVLKSSDYEKNPLHSVIPLRNK